jgi:hypothetical protein
LGEYRSLFALAMAHHLVIQDGIVKLFPVAKGNDDLSQYDPELTRSANPGKHSGLSYFVPFAEPPTHQLAIVQCRQCMPTDPKLDCTPS